jgi:hypothetical protein
MPTTNAANKESKRIQEPFNKWSAVQEISKKLGSYTKGQRKAILNVLLNDLGLRTIPMGVSVNTPTPQRFNNATQAKSGKTKVQYTKVQKPQASQKLAAYRRDPEYIKLNKEREQFIENVKKESPSDANSATIADYNRRLKALKDKNRALTSP